jgi:mannose-P-dolichol utilization defect protein 1
MLDCMALLKKGELYQECFQIYISKALGLSIVLLSSILKIPQIRNIIKDESIEGITALSIYCELLVFYLSSLYAIHVGIPFSTYGENVLLFIQGFVILLLYWKYSGPCKCPLTQISRVLVVLGLVGFAAVSTYEGGSMIPENVWKMIGSCSIPIVFLGRTSLIVNSISAKSTGTLSLFNYVMNFGGNLARMFTLFSETTEYLLIFSQLFCSVLNFSICVLIWSYGPKKLSKVNKTD